MKKTLLALLLLVAVLLSGCAEAPGEPGGYVSSSEDSGHEKSAPSVEATPTSETPPEDSPEPQTPKVIHTDDILGIYVDVLKSNVSFYWV